MKTIYKSLFVVAAAATLLVTGCSIKNPNDSFKLAVEGTFEKAIMDSLRAQAGGMDTTLFTSTRLVGTSVTDEADLVAVGSVSFNPTSAMVLAEINIINMNGAGLSALLPASFVNNSSNAVDVGVYISSQAGLGTGIVNNTNDRILGFSIPANSSFNTATGAMTSYLTPTDVLLLINAINSNQRVTLYVHASGTPAMDLTISSLSLRLPSSYMINQNVTPGDVSNYSLESLSSVGLGGTIGLSSPGNTCDSVKVVLSCKSGTGSDTTAAGMIQIGSYTAVNSTRNANYSIDLATISSSLLTTSGRTVLSQRFTEMFPPTSLGSFFRVSVSVYPISSAFWTYNVSDLRVIANARVNQN